MRKQLLVLVFTLAACGDRGEPDTAEMVAPDSAVQTEPEPAAGLDRPAGGLGTAQMQDVRGGQTGGDILLADRGGETEVRVSLTNVQPNAEVTGHVHSGTCAAIGPVVEPLDPVRTDSTGTGMMNTAVDLQRAQLMDGRHIIVYHGPDGQPLACAVIPLPTVTDQSSTI
jgi:hypothetical protein